MKSKLEIILSIARQIIECETDRHWLIQHGKDDGQTFEQINDGIDLLNSQITKLRSNLLDIIEG